jgi:hypothetical protein
MLFMFFAVGVAAVFFVGSLFALYFGQRLGHHYRRVGGDGIGGLGTLESAIFGLMGLLLAFTISGALQRFDDRRQLVLQEASAAVTAYDRIDLLGAQMARPVQGKLKDYVQARVDLYRIQHDFLLLYRMEDFSREQQDRLFKFKDDLWRSAVAACPKDAYLPACGMMLPALNSLFEVAQLRAGAAEKHPPHIIYGLLFGLGLGCSLLAGFGIGASGGRSWMHMVLFAGTLTAALYIVTDMEYPRLGLIRIEGFDHFLADTLNHMG